MMSSKVTTKSAEWKASLDPLEGSEYGSDPCQQRKLGWIKQEHRHQPGAFGVIRDHGTPGKKEQLAMQGRSPSPDHHQQQAEQQAINEGDATSMVKRVHTTTCRCWRL